MNHLEFTIINSRLFFTPFDEKNDRDPVSGRAGVLVHGWLTAFVNSILAKIGLTSGILTTHIDGQSIHFNRGSFTKWCQRHHSEFHPNDNVIDKVNEIVAEFIQQQIDEEEEKLEKEKTKLEKLKNIQTVALDHLKQMTSICYNPDGQLNTKLIKDHHLFKSINISLDDTFFTNEIFTQNTIKDPKKGLESTFKVYPLSQTIFYHGTLPVNAEKIKGEGFNPLALTLTGTDSGAGTYLTEQREAALNYAKGDEKGLLSCRIQPDIKIAHLTPEAREIFNVFRWLISTYITQNEAVIKKDLQALKVEDISLSFEFETKLWNIFVRDFFLRSGYRGLYTEYSGLAECSYLNLLDPQKDILEIK